MQFCKMNIQELQPSHTFYPKILAPFSLTAEAFFQPFMLFFFREKYFSDIHKKKKTNNGKDILYLKVTQDIPDLLCYMKTNCENKNLKFKKVTCFSKLPRDYIKGTFNVRAVRQTHTFLNFSFYSFQNLMLHLILLQNNPLAFIKNVF